MSPGPHLTTTPLKDANFHIGLLRAGTSSLGESSNDQDTAPLVAVIDDSLTMRRIVESLCQRHHLRVQTFPAGEPAITAWERGDLPPPDLIVMDVQLPGASGYDLTRWCAEQPALRNTPVVLLSGHRDRWHVLRGRWTGAVAYLPKPFASGQLVKVLLDQLARVRPEWHPERGI